MLKSAKAGDFIQLGPNKYETFISIPEKITLKGVGPSTVIEFVPPINRKYRSKPALYTCSNDVKISDLKIVCPTPPADSAGLDIAGSRNIIRNITLENCRLGLDGNDNVVENIRCDGGHDGLLITGGKNNSVSNVSCRNLQFGISILKKAAVMSLKMSIAKM